MSSLFARNVDGENTGWHNGLICDEFFPIRWIYHSNHNATYHRHELYDEIINTMIAFSSWISHDPATMRNRPEHFPLPFVKSRLFFATWYSMLWTEIASKFFSLKFENRAIFFRMLSRARLLEMMCVSSSFHWDTGVQSRGFAFWENPSGHRIGSCIEAHSLKK